MKYAQSLSALSFRLPEPHHICLSLCCRHQRKLKAIVAGSAGEKLLGAEGTAPSTADIRMWLLLTASVRCCSQTVFLSLF